MAAPALHSHPVDDDRRFDLSGGALCLSFSNTWGDRARPDSDRLATYPDLLSFARQAGLVNAAELERLRRRAARRPEEAAVALAGARRLRDALYRLFSARANGRRVGPADVEAVNAALREALPHLLVEPRDGGFAWAWKSAEADLGAPLRPIARSAAELLVSDDLARVRECHGATCTWLFLDGSRNRSRRWCSMESCGNREKAKRHYSRQQRRGET